MKICFCFVLFCLRNYIHKLLLAFKEIAILWSPSRQEPLRLPRFKAKSLESVWQQAGCDICHQRRLLPDYSGKDDFTDLNVKVTDYIFQYISFLKHFAYKDLFFGQAYSILYMVSMSFHSSFFFFFTLLSFLSKFIIFPSFVKSFCHLLFSCNEFSIHQTSC